MASYYFAIIGDMSGNGTADVKVSRNALPPEGNQPKRGTITVTSTGSEPQTASLFLHSQPTIKVVGSDTVPSTGGTIQVAVSSSYTFSFYNPRSYIKSIKKVGDPSVDYRNGELLPAGDYVFNVEILGNSTSSKINGYITIEIRREDHSDRNIYYNAYLYIEGDVPRSYYWYQYPSSMSEVGTY